MEDGRDDYGWEEGQLVVGTAIKQLKCTQRSHMFMVKQILDNVQP